MKLNLLDILRNLKTTGRLTALTLFSLVLLAILAAYITVPPLVVTSALALALLSLVSLTPRLLRLGDVDASFNSAIGLGFLLGLVLAMIAPVLLYSTQSSFSAGPFGALEPLVGVYAWTRVIVGIVGVPLAGIGALLFGLSSQKVVDLTTASAAH